MEGTKWRSQRKSS